MIPLDVRLSQLITIAIVFTLREANAFTTPFSRISNGDEEMTPSNRYLFSSGIFLNHAENRIMVFLKIVRTIVANAFTTVQPRAFANVRRSMRFFSNDLICCVSMQKTK